MIHFLLLDETMPDLTAAPEPPAPPPPPRPRLPFPLPAEYYATPERKPAIVPRGVPIGCGTAALAFLVLFGVSGAMVSGERGGRLTAWLFTTMQSEADGQFTKDVPAEQRKEFDAQFQQLRDNVAAHRVKLARMQPFLERLRDASADDKITPDEAKALIDALRAVNKQ